LVLPSAYEAFLAGHVAYDREDFRRASQQFEKALRTDPRSSYLLAWLARAEVGQRRWTRARRALDRSLEADGCSEFAYCVAAEILVAQGKAGDAMRALRRAIECEPRQREAYLELASLFEQQGAPERAQETLRSLAALRPDDSGAHRELTRLALAQGQIGQAARHLSAVLALAPWRASTALELARLHLLQGYVVTARALLETVVARRPRLEQGRRLLVKTLLAMGLTGHAAERLAPWSVDGEDPTALAELALLLSRAHLFEAAAEEARRALALDGAEPLAREVLVASLRRQPGALGGAVRLVRQWSSGSPGTDEALAQLGQGLWETGQRARARQLLEGQLRRAPASPSSRLLLARLLIDQGQYDQAAELVRSGPTHRDRVHWGQLLLEQGRLADARRAADRAATEAEPSWAALVLRGRVLVVDGGDVDEVAVMLDRAAHLAPLEPEIWALRGELACRTGRRAQGLSWLRRAHEVQPTSTAMAERLARALAQGGQCGEAVQVAQRALRFRPPPWLRQRLAALAEQSQDCSTQERARPWRVN
jgi:tetratricopeptide (TPR) repeat protein